ncbi:MAG TPA: hypothetical protein VH142_18025 [Polyangiaceae bacterium]|nr:hypothetical protein [Polyangiaceae bacterium]
MKTWSVVLALLLLGGCHRDQDAKGPFEKAGEGLDTAAEKTGTAVKGAAKATAEGATTAVHATGHAFKKVGDKLSGSDSKSDGGS